MSFSIRVNKEEEESAKRYVVSHEFQVGEA